MIAPITKSLSKSILESVEIEKTVYAEVNAPGGMGNSGGVIMYIPHAESGEMICYETSIFNDEETYLLAEEILNKHSKMIENENAESLFEYYYGGMGNNVFVNRKANLSIGEEFFVYKLEKSEFQIFSSVKGVFKNVIYQMQKAGKG
jgi:hypothetical protein